MTAQLIGAIILWLIVAIVAIAIIVYLVNWLYRRSSKEVSFVRTGLMGERVVINGGAFVLPIIHDITPVNMNVLQMSVARAKDDALITKDRMRVDIDADFYVRVAPTRDAVSLAAATLGRRTMEQERLHALLSGKFVSALRSVASEMTMVEMHEQRGRLPAARQGRRRRGAGPERARARDRGADRPRPDRPAVLQSVEPLRCRRSDHADRRDRGPPQAQERHRAGLDDPHPHPQPRSREAGPRPSSARASRPVSTRSATSRSAAPSSGPSWRASVPCAIPRPSVPRSPRARRSRRPGSPTRRPSARPASLRSGKFASARSSASAPSRRPRSPRASWSRRPGSPRSAS